MRLSCVILCGVKIFYNREYFVIKLSLKIYNRVKFVIKVSLENY